MKDINKTFKRSPKIMIITRFLPIKNTGGSELYLYELITYLINVDIKLNVLILEPTPSLISTIFLISCRINKYCKTIFRTIRIGGVLFRLQYLYDIFLIGAGILYNILPSEKRYVYQNILYSLLLKIKFFTPKKKASEKVGYSDWSKRVVSKISAEELAFIDQQINTFNPDILLTNYVFTADSFNNILSRESILRVILTHDVFTQRYEQFKNLNLNPDILWEDVNNEMKQLKKANLLLSIQDSDTKTLKKMVPSCEVLTVPMPATFKKLDSKFQINSRCLFVGSNAKHNVVGINWFLNNVWPQVLKRFSDCHLHICGNVCRGINNIYDNVSLLDRIENLEREYAQAAVCIIPLTVGSGLKIKTIEALSYGRICVSTSIGIQGLEDLSDKAILVGNTVDEFSMHLISILLNKKKRYEMEAYAQKFVEENLSPDLVYRPLLDKFYKHIKASI